MSYRVMVALMLRARVACIQARGKGKKYIVEKYLDGCVKSSNDGDFILFYFILYHVFIVKVQELSSCVSSTHPAIEISTPRDYHHFSFLHPPP